jgi:hypothetical protein
MNESQQAEIIWFVRGTTLYRRVLLIDTNNDCTTTELSSIPFYKRNDVSVYLNRSGTPTVERNTMSTIARRENRFAHTITTFPYPLYDDSTNEAWYFLRMPTLEETVNYSPSFSWRVGYLLPTSITSFDITSPSFPALDPYWDFWKNPNGFSGNMKNSDGTTTPWQLDPTSGSLSTHTDIDSSTPGIQRDSRAGEDIVLKNVISFDVKVWNPYWVPIGTGTDYAPPQYVDLGQDHFPNPADNSQLLQVDYTRVLPTTGDRNYGYGFTLKGRYNTATENRRTVDNATEKWHRAERLYNGTDIDTDLWSGSSMPCVFDSWTKEYQNAVLSENVCATYSDTDPWTWNYPPPYTEDLRSIQITIRCFEPQSGHIKQIRVVQSF